MLQPNELKRELPMRVGNNEMSTTTKVWEILTASKKGDLEQVKKLVDECQGLVYAQYNYAPPIHFAVREGHEDLVAWLLEQGAHNPGYRIYPFHNSLQTQAEDRGYTAIAGLLTNYAADTSRHRYKGDNGEIYYNRTALQEKFEKTVDSGNVEKTRELLEQDADLIKDETYFWGEGILTFAAKENNRPMIDLLISYGAKVPNPLKWTQFYYFEHDEGAAYIMEKGMNPNTMSWHHVTILHDMAQKGNIQKAGLLLDHGADINPVDEEYQSTPLGMAVRWGHIEMVEFLLKKGADPNRSGASWATPLAWAVKKKHPEIERLLIKSGAVE